MSMTIEQAKKALAAANAALDCVESSENAKDLEGLTPVIVRSHLAGVIFGYTDVTDPLIRATQTVDLVRARKIWSWSSALAPESIASHGIASTSKITAETSQIVTGVTQCIRCTQKSVSSIAAIEPSTVKA